MEAVGGDGDASVAESVGVGLALVAEHVSFGGDDQGGRQAGELLEAGPQGEAVGSARWAGSLVYWSQDHYMASRRRLVERTAARHTLLTYRESMLSFFDSIDHR